MAADLWFRNPRNYIRQLRDCGASDFAWDRWVLRQYDIDPGLFGELWMKGLPWRGLIIGEQGVDLITHESPDQPLYRMPAWKMGIHTPRQLLKWVETNPEPEAPHLVTVMGVGSVSQKVNRRFMFDLAELQQENPHCKIHVHGMYSYRFLFGLGFRSVDYDGRQQAAQGRVILPNGKYLLKPMEQKEDHRMWVDLIGERDFTDKGEICTYNVMSAQWAARHWETDVNFRVTPLSDDQLDSQSLDDWLHSGPPSRGENHAGGGKRAPEDMITCNTCSLQLSCKLYREGSVCTVPNSDGVKLSKFFGSPDQEVVLDGLIGILEWQESRASRAISIEEARIERDQDRMNQLADGTLTREDLPQHFDGPMMDPETTKIVGELARTGVSIARLRKPSAPLVSNVNVVGGGAVPAQISESATTAQVVAILEGKGWVLEEGHANSITQDLIDQVTITGKAPPAELPAAVTLANIIEEEE